MSEGDAPREPKSDSSEPNFDHVARVYRWAEWAALGPLLVRTRRWFTARLADRRQALVLGDGDGRFTAHLLAANPHIRVHCVDISARMLGLLRGRCAPWAARLTTEQASALHVTPAAETDLIVSHFFLDCLLQVQTDALAEWVAEHVRPGTLWLVSDFGVPRARWLRPLATAYVRGLYAAFHLLTGLRVSRLPDPESSLSAAGFVRVARQSFVGGMLYTEVWELRGGLQYNRESRRRDAMGETASEPMQDTVAPRGPHAGDAQPDPEPAVPSLDAPDAAVFHHDVPTTEPQR